ncbi:D-tagatose-bisphosphate aldolase, class II, non-catalytic subunit [Roseateles saccharophilus]|uniref:Tagatose-bisphosphate aldolase noncatalytic subunit n=1 Tax=Roseateles saccharophilus TaxID=304 RepID=A0A4R3UG54_ROSSA|nr:D-tagatose-bisphosphate aldolase, class II, non-catalytic subunit [Roseateles saccharophilus]MDG0835241.1 D-tagatose-bisphosphate aldolase, class II, non-catalytic subunit [Roseateles saccharophilus]TCU86867.1 tagatose-bisphosphate aldolase noncatalytic subunit [Roseateles saccharophilus]
MSTTSPILDTIAAHRRGEPVGVASVCCSNRYVLEAAMQLARQRGGLLLIESTSNQVDQFGGYTGMTPPQFRDYVQAMAHAQGLPAGRLVLGGDHLGPNAWQNLPAAEAMGHAKELIQAYVAAGFHKIHLDCSMACADDLARLPDEVVAQRSAELAEMAEAAARGAGLAPPVYVIGTEVPIPGGEAALGGGVAVTRPEAAAQTLEVHRLAFAARGLREAWRRVVAMVVQPGVDFDHSSVQHYDRAAAASLSRFIEGQPGLVYEAHSTDYQTEASLHAMVRDHFAILKVGPAATFALREAWFALAMLERELLPAAAQSRLIETLDGAMRAQPRHWLKHYPGSPEAQRLLRAWGLSDRSRYYWGEPAVEAALQRLVANLDEQPLPLALLSQFLPEQALAVSEGRLAARAEDLARHKVGQLLARYARACEANEAAAIESPTAAPVSNP